MQFMERMGKSIFHLLEEVVVAVASNTLTFKRARDVYPMNCYPEPTIFRFSSSPLPPNSINTRPHPSFPPPPPRLPPRLPNPTLHSFLLNCNNGSSRRPSRAPRRCCPHPCRAPHRRQGLLDHPDPPRDRDRREWTQA